MGTRYWIAVASADHTRRGGAGGFMQVNHGKEAPLRRLHPGDGIVYYSPTEIYGRKERLQAFTLIGRVADADIYPGEMGGWTAFRRNVDWAHAKDAPIAPLLDRLEFTRGRKTWGYQLRFGLFEISKADFDLIAAAMDANVPDAG
jgi:hypothetical protein